MTYEPIEQLKVYLDHNDQRQYVGRLLRHERKLLFEYDPIYIVSGVSISPFKLPLKSGIFLPEEQCFEGLFGVFNDSLPDGWGRLLLDRTVEKLGIRRYELGALDRLAFVGHYGMGALSYEPTKEDLLKNPHLDHVPLLDVLAEESRQILAGEIDDIFPELLMLNGASAGARPKIVADVSHDKKSIIYGSKTSEDTYDAWIIKFASLNDPKDIGAIEYAYSLMAKDAGIHMPETYLFSCEKGQYFGAKRFDRRGKNRIHMHSLSGLIHADYRIPALDYDTILSVVMMLTKKMICVEQAFLLACFNVFTHNRDDHSKNFSFVLDDQNQWWLSGAYDLTFSYGPQGEHQTTIMGEGRSPSREHLEKLGIKHGIKHVSALIEQVRSVTAQWLSYAKKAGVSHQSMIDIANYIRP